MNNQYKVGDRVVCVAPKDAQGYSRGDKGTIVPSTHDPRVNWDNGKTTLVYPCEIQPLNEKESNNMNEKTYTVTLTELEAKVLRMLSGMTGSSSDKPDSIAKAITGIFYKVGGVSDTTLHSCKEGFDKRVREAWNVLKDLPHGQSITPPSVTISLNDYYKAEVSEEGVTVDKIIYSWNEVQALKDAVGEIVAGATTGWKKVNGTKELQIAMADGQEVYYTSSICNPDYNEVWTKVSACHLDDLPLFGTYRTRKSLDSVNVPVGRYTAVVTKDSIKVGCQTFPTSIVDTLLANKPQ